MRAALVILFCLAAGQGLARAGEFAAQARPESLVPVRPGGAGKPFWNAQAKQFMVAPAFDFKVVNGAGAYRFTIATEGGKSVSFEANEPWETLASVWADVPAGSVTLTVEALKSRGGDVIGAAGTRSFHRAAVFDGPYGKAVLPYAESARVALKSVIDEEFVRSWRTSGKPDAKYPLYRYASKVIGSVMSAAAMYAGQSPRPADADEALEIGRAAGDFLIGVSAPPGSSLEYFPPTYHGAKATERENDQWTMLMSGAEAGQGYLDLYDATHEQKYLDAAVRIAGTYKRLQRASGTWALKVDNRTGEPIAPIDLIPSVVISFLDRLIGEHQTTQFQPMLDRAVKWTMENPAATFDWKAQFDDGKLRGPYENLSKHEACEFACYLFRRGQNELAEELLRFAEDQFVVWEHPPAVKARSENLRSENWFVPCSLEQYAMFEPISGSSAFMIVAYVRAHHATGKGIYLAKAQSLANALTAAQEFHHGRYPTRMVKQDLAYWINSTVNCVRAMRMLAAEETKN